MLQFEGKFDHLALLTQNEKIAILLNSMTFHIALFGLCCLKIFYLINILKV